MERICDVLQRVHRRLRLGAALADRLETVRGLDTESVRPGVGADAAGEGADQADDLEGRVEPEA